MYVIVINRYVICVITYSNIEYTLLFASNIKILNFKLKKF